LIRNDGAGVVLSCLAGVFEAELFRDIRSLTGRICFRGDSPCDSNTDRPNALRTGGGWMSSSESSPTPMLLNGNAPEEKPCECANADNGESLRTSVGLEGACRAILPFP